MAGLHIFFFGHMELGPAFYVWPGSTVVPLFFFLFLNGAGSVV